VIDVHSAGRLEVGFSTFGPTLGLQGTMQALNGDEFISVSKVTVERVADNLRHEFQWAVFRPQSQSFSGTAQQTFEIASGLLLGVAAPRRFNIQFHDSGTADNFRQPLIDLHQLWDRQFYWIQGAYRMTFELRTSRPAKSFRFNHTFALSDAESKLLRFNCIGCILTTCNVPDIVYNFAFPVYSRV
jgi:hypothetical protein